MEQGVVQLQVHDDAFDPIYTYPCWIYDEILLQHASALSESQFVVVAWEGGQEGYIHKYGNWLILTYTDVNHGYFHLYYDQNYGWLPVNLSVASYTTGMFEALSWFAADTFVGNSNIRITIIPKENSSGRVIHDFSFGKF